MTIMLPNDPRALRNTGKVWIDEDGDEQPVMKDGLGREFQVRRFTAADFFGNKGKGTAKGNAFLDRLAKGLSEGEGEESELDLWHIGFQLPKGEAVARKRTAPIPELTDEGEWVVIDSPILESAAGLDDSGGGVMFVPCADDSPEAQLVRSHELAHARWTPRNLPKGSDRDHCMQLAEDARMWRRLRTAGVDTTAAAFNLDELQRRLDQQPPLDYLLGLLVATRGTGDAIPVRDAFLNHCGNSPEAKELVAKAEAIVSHYFDSLDWPEFDRTAEAAECIRDLRWPPQPQPEGEGEGQPGDSEGDSEGEGASGEGEGEGEAGSSEGNSAEGQPGEGQPGEGEGQPGEGQLGEGEAEADSEGEGEGEGQPGDGSQRGTSGLPDGEGGPSQRPKPTAQKKGAITKALNKRKAEKAKAIAEAKQQELDTSPETALTPAERAAGEATAKALREVMENYGARYIRETTDPGEMEIRNVPLPNRLPARMRGTNYRSATYGGRIGSAARVHSDGYIFRSRQMSKGGGTVLIDCSGSMALTLDEVEAMLAAAPAVTVATYAGSGSYGELRIVAKNGRRCETQDLQYNGGGNIIDLPALEWLGKQRSRPRIWVSDGLVTGCNDSLAVDLFERCSAVCRRFGIHRVDNVEELMALAKGRS